jgi:magnesium chelatase family protein
MNKCQVRSYALHGFVAYPITIDVEFGERKPLQPGDYPPAAVEVVRCAFAASGFKWPTTLKLGAMARLVGDGPLGAEGNQVKLGPQTSFDFAVAYGALVSTKQIPAFPNDAAFMGSLSLNGDVQTVRGTRAALKAHLGPLYTAAGCPRLVNLRDEAKLVPGPCKVMPWGGDATSPRFSDGAPIPSGVTAKLQDALTRRAPILLLGAASMWTGRRLNTLLPDLTTEEAEEVAIIADAAGLPTPTGRPFRAPHHTVSRGSLLGTAIVARPGEVQLAKHGILYFDNAHEFGKDCLSPLAVSDTRLVLASIPEHETRLRAVIPALETIHLDRAEAP